MKLEFKKDFILGKIICLSYGQKYFIEKKHFLLMIISPIIKALNVTISLKKILLFVQYFLNLGKKSKCKISIGF